MRCLKQLVDGLPDGVRRTVQRVSSFFPALGLSQSLSHADYLSKLGKARKKWGSWAVFWMAGGAGCLFTMLSLSPLGGITGEGVSLGSEQCCLGGEVMQIK